MTTKTRTAVCVALLVVALAFRLALALSLPNDEPDDGRFYSLIAQNVLLHGAYSGSAKPPLEPTYARVPGYPLFIAGVYRLFGVGNDTAVRVAQAVVETATCWLVACLALALAPAAWPQERRRPPPWRCRQPPAARPGRSPAAIRPRPRWGSTRFQ